MHVYLVHFAFDILISKLKANQPSLTIVKEQHVVLIYFCLDDFEHTVEVFLPNNHSSYYQKWRPGSLIVKPDTKDQNTDLTDLFACNVVFPTECNQAPIPRTVKTSVDRHITLYPMVNKCPNQTSLERQLSYTGSLDVRIRSSGDVPQGSIIDV